MYIKNQMLKLKATANSGSPFLTIQKYEWTINDIINSNITDELIINTNNLNQSNTIKLRVQNSEPCNKWSEYVTKIIEVSNMEQTFTVLVNKPKVSTEVVIQMNGIVEVTVKDQIGTPFPNVSVKIDEISAITNESGIATLENVNYGTKTGTITF